MPSIGAAAVLTEVLVRVAFAPVAHEAVATSVLGVSHVVIGRVAVARVVDARMRQAQGMADFVGQGLAPVVVGVRGFVDLVLVVDHVPGLAIVLAALRQIGERRATGVVAVVAEGHVTVAAGTFAEGDFGHVRPGLHRQHRLGFLLGAEFTERAEGRVVVRRFRRQEGVTEVDLAVAVLVMPGRPFTQDLVGGLIGGERGFAVDQNAAATVVQVAEGVDGRVGVTGPGFCLRHCLRPCLKVVSFRQTTAIPWRDRPVTAPYAGALKLTQLET